MNSAKRYEITGVEVSGKRFKICTHNRMHALAINLWRGSVWSVSEEGRRRLMKRVYNQGEEWWGKWSK